MVLPRLWRRVAGWRESRAIEQHAVPDALWQQVVSVYPFLATRSAGDLQELRRLVSLFLARKEFHGAQSLPVTDDMAVAIAAQACLPILKLGIEAYDDFVGIVVHPGEMTVRREVMDDDGVVHEYHDELLGETTADGGPVTLAWDHVLHAGTTAAEALNVVIHEFAHVLDRADGALDGVPLLPTTAARERWIAVIDEEYERFADRIDAGELDTALDPYGAEAVDEFFAVAVEAFFVAPAAMRREHPALYGLFAGYFRQDPLA